MTADSDPSGDPGIFARRSFPTFLSYLVSAVIFLFFAAACDPGGEENPPEEPDARPEISLATNAETTIEETTSALDQYADGETTSEGTTQDEPDAVVRLEGERGTRFTGICNVGERQNVLSGNVPGRFEFILEDEELSCEIQKRTDSGGSLRVVLTSGGETRSVQQTSNAGGEVRISFTRESPDPEPSRG